MEKCYWRERSSSQNGIGKELAVNLAAYCNMRQIYRLSRHIWQKKAFRWVITALLGALCGIGVGHTVIASLSGSISVVDGMSMAPTYVSGERVYTAPISSALRRGDIVLINDGKQDYALKRIVGMPGETVHLWRGYIFINRKMLQEPYLPKHTYTCPSQETEICVFNLGEDQYFVLGDNRTCSVDSRAYGPVERARIKSRVPMPDSILRPRFLAFTLPADGKRTIRPLYGQ